MLFIAKYDASHYFLINSDYMPFKCGADIRTFEIKEIYRNDDVYEI